MRKIYQFLMLVASMTMFSCGSSNSNDEPEPTPSVNIILRSQSINEGAEVDAASTTVLTLDYNTTVRVTGSGITLNGTAVTAKSNAKTAMSVDIPLDLKEAKSYTLKVEKGAIVSTTDANSSAPEFTLNFTTKEGAKPCQATRLGLESRQPFRHQFR